MLTAIIIGVFAGLAACKWINIVDAEKKIAARDRK